MSKDNENRYLTESGVEITDGDLRAIKKKSFRQAAVGTLAVIGAGTIAWFVRGFVTGNLEVVSYPKDYDVDFTATE